MCSIWTKHAKILPKVAEMSRIKVLWDCKFQTKKQLQANELDKEQKTTVVIDVAILSNNNWTSSGKWMVLM